MNEWTRIIVTGASGFIGRNLCVRLSELGHVDVVPVTRANAHELDVDALARADLVFHLAGVSRPRQVAAFVRDNVDFTRRICDLAARSAKPVPIVFASSVQAALQNPYGESKRAGEAILAAYAQETGARTHILRLTNVFGKWSRPDYNSVVATVCYNAARGLPPPTGDPTVPLLLTYIDDVVDVLIGLISGDSAEGPIDVRPVYRTTLGAVVDMVRAFSEGRRSLVVPRAADGLERGLHATYLANLEPAGFAYDVPVYGDDRGEFIEVLKTEDSGQISYFTARPGVTRGSHYHHSKTEKFVVVHGVARFGFRRVDTGETFETVVRGGEGRIVEIPPGWVHDVTNIGEEELVCVIWANEVFDRTRPDTVAAWVSR